MASIITPSNFHVFKLQYLTLNLGVSILTLTPVPKRLFRSAAPVFLGEARALGTRSRDDQNGKVDPQQEFDEKDSKKERILYVGGSSYFFVCILID